MSQKPRPHATVYRAIAAALLGRPLRGYWEAGGAELVHHVNGDPFDNRPENLVICSFQEHAALHRGGDEGERTLRQCRERQGWAA